MSIVVSCQCGQQFQAPPHLAGKQVPCPACKRPLNIGQNGPQTAAQQQAPSQQQAIPVACQCGGQFQAPANLAGQQVKCPRCGGMLTVGTGPAAQAQAQAAQVQAAQAAQAQAAAQAMQIPNFAAAATTAPSATGGLWDDEFPEAARATQAAPSMPSSMSSPKGQAQTTATTKRSGGEMPDVTRIAYNTMIGLAILNTLSALFLTGYAVYCVVGAISDNSGFDVLTIFLIVLAVIAWIMPILCLIGVRAFKRRSGAARPLAVIVGVLIISGFPVGTYLGFLLLRGAFSEETKAYLG